MATEGPVYKAALSKSLFERIGELPAVEREAIVDKLGSDHVKVLETASRTAWIPAAVEAALDMAILEVLGHDRLIEYIAEYTESAAEVPIFTPIYRGVINVFGSGPRGIFKILPRTWTMISRGCGRCVFEESADGMQLAYLDVAEVLRNAAFATTAEGGVLGMLRMTGCADDYVIEADPGELDAGTMRVYIRPK